VATGERGLAELLLKNSELAAGDPIGTGLEDFMLKTRITEQYGLKVPFIPHRILGGSSNDLLQWRQRISEYWFWDRGRDVLTKEEALQSVIIGDTLDGDELIVHPSNPERVFVLPRNRDEIYVAGDGLPEAMEWLCSSGTLTEAFDERNFEPFDTRRAAD